MRSPSPWQRGVASSEAKVFRPVGGRQRRSHMADEHSKTSFYPVKGKGKGLQQANHDASISPKLRPDGETPPPHPQSDLVIAEQRSWQNAFFGEQEKRQEAEKRCAFVGASE